MRVEDLVAPFRRSADAPYEVARELKAGGRPVVGYTCSYFPEEIALAAGAHPLRLSGEAGSIMLADAHLQAYACALARSLLEDGLAGELAAFDAIVFPHGCDTLQRLSDIWRLNVAGPRHLDLVLPVKLDSAAARSYLEAVLERCRAELGAVLGVEVDEAALAAAVHLMNRVRRAIEALYRERSARPEALAGADLAAVVRGATVMERAAAAEGLEALVEAVRGRSARSPKGDVARILLSGSVCRHPEVHEIVEAGGGAVVFDDLCAGSRAFAGEVDEEAPPIAALAARLAGRVVCPAKHAGVERRAHDLVSMIREHRIDGVVFMLLKFCDPHAFDYPDLRRALEAEGVATLYLELEGRGAVDGPTRNRLETFLELLAERRRA